MFRDRLDAARQLADRLSIYRGMHPLILGIPQGAVPMSEYIAREPQGEFDVLARSTKAVGLTFWMVRAAELVDDMVCLETPAPFRAVGQFYQDFGQVDNDEVIEILSVFLSGRLIQSCPG